MIDEGSTSEKVIEVLEKMVVGWREVDEVQLRRSPHNVE